MKLLFCLVFLFLFGCAWGAREPTRLVRCRTTAGEDPVDIELQESWSPLGVARFLELVKDGYYDNSPIFRVVPNFLTQFGMSLDQEKENYWMNKRIVDENPHVHHEFTRGTVSFAGNGQDSRTTQLFISFGDNPHLGKAMHETPIGKVVSGMEVVDNFFGGNGKFSMDMPPWGKAPDQNKIRSGGKQYLDDNYPELSYIIDCKEVSGIERRREEIRNKQRERLGEEVSGRKWDHRYDEKLKRKEQRRAMREDNDPRYYDVKAERKEREEIVQQKLDDLGLDPGSEEYSIKKMELRKLWRQEYREKKRRKRKMEL